MNKKKLLLSCSALFMTLGLSACGSKEHVHVWNDISYTWNADQTECVAKRVCADDPTHIETANARISVENKIKATCEAQGLDIVTASFDADWALTQKENKYLVATEHAWGEPTYTWNADNSSCVATRVCTKDAKHKETSVATVSVAHSVVPTCTNSGKDTYTANFSDTWASKQTKVVDVSKIEHKWGEATYEWNADNTACTATRVCLNDSTHKETASASISVDHKIAAACECEGLDVITATFSVSWAKKQELNVYPEEAGHEWEEEVEYTWNETYSECNAVRTCKNCRKKTGKYKSFVVTPSVVTAPTCTTDGVRRYTATWMNTQTWAKAQTIDVAIPATGHTWGEPEYFWNKDSGGNIKYYDGTNTCTVCGATEFDHGTVTSITTNATCTADGYISYYATTNQPSWGKNGTHRVSIAATGHNWNATTYEWSINEHNEEVCIATRTCKNDPTHIETSVGDVESEVLYDATCTTELVIRSIATFEDEWAETSTHVFLDEPHGHQLNMFGTCAVCHKDTFTSFDLDFASESYYAMKKTADPYCDYEYVMVKSPTAKSVHFAVANATIESVVSVSGTEQTPSEEGYYSMLANTEYYLKISVTDREEQFVFVATPNTETVMMDVESVELVTGHGTLFTGTLKQNIATNDKVRYFDISTLSYVEGTVTTIRIEGSTVDDAEAGEYVSLIVRGVSFNDVAAGILLLAGAA